MDRRSRPAYPCRMNNDHGRSIDDAPPFDVEVDAAGLLCPLPVLRARKRLKSMGPGAVLRLISTDPAALIDVPHFCAESGHSLIATRESGATRHYYIRKT